MDLVTFIHSLYLVFMYYCFSILMVESDIGHHIFLVTNLYYLMELKRKKERKKS